MSDTVHSIMLWLDRVPLWIVVSALIVTLTGAMILDEELRLRRWEKMSGRRWWESRWGNGGEE